MRPAYFYALQRYQSALSQRNALLKTNAVSAMLADWDEQLAQAAVEIVRARQWYVGALSESAAAYHLAISGAAKERLVILYEGQLSASVDPYRDMLKGLEQSRMQDMQRRTTHFGPHRDEMQCYLFDRELKQYGSQGQQRTAVLAMKLAELAMIQREHGEAPVLLLDDVMSELDPSRRAFLLENMGGVQAFMTCTAPEDLADARAQQVYTVEGGNITRLS